MGPAVGHFIGGPLDGETRLVGDLWAYRVPVAPLLGPTVIGPGDVLPTDTVSYDVYEYTPHESWTIGGRLHALMRLRP